VLVAVVLSPACDAVMTQLPVLLRVTVAEETPPTPLTTGVTDSLPLTMEHGPDVLKLTCSPFGVLLDSAVAETGTVEGGEFEIDTELGNGPSTMVCPTVSTAGGEGALERGFELTVSGTSVVAIV
jgi:hypothetical protein